MKNVIIIGGGLAGLISGIALRKKGVPCLLIEKKQYPFHRVCGEYISNEVVPYLKKNDLYPEIFSPPQITTFQLTSVRGKSATMPLDLGAFGISRYTFDNFLYDKAKSAGVEFKLESEVTNVSYHDGSFEVSTLNSVHRAEIVIGAFGKRSKLDIALNRAFIKKRSPYVGVKYHFNSEHKRGLIALHNFLGGYCGVSHVENNITNVCYLVKREVLQKHKNIREMEEHTLFQNPFLKDIFFNGEPLFDKPIVINEISFETKSPVENHIFMAGDSAGMIAPLCGNGMAMAIHSAKLLTDILIEFANDKITREETERQYTKQWRKLFASRLQVGRTVQQLFGNNLLSQVAVNTVIHSKSIAQMIMRRTHGDYF